MTQQSTINKPDTVYTMDLVETVFYYYLFQARITLDFIKEKDKWQPLFIVKGWGIKALKEKMRICRDKHTNGLDMEAIFINLRDYVDQELKSRLQKGVLK